MKLERIIAIIMLLLNKEKISGKELAKQFEVSLRTIYRDIESINQAGIPIVTISGVGGGISIMKQYKIDKGIFTEKDITTMLIGLGFMSGTLSGAEIANTLTKIKSFIPKERQKEITLKANQISFDLSSWTGIHNLQPKIELIRSALDNNRKLMFLYPHQQNGKNKRIIEPYKLLLKESFWYLQGYCLEKQAFRVFKLSRMTQLTLIDEEFDYRDTPPAFSTFITDMTQKMNKIKLEIDTSILGRMLDYCDESDITLLENGRYSVEFNFIEDDHGYGILMSLGDKCICVEPEHIRVELKKRLNKILEHY